MLIIEAVLQFDSDINYVGYEFCIVFCLIIELIYI